MIQEQQVGIKQLKLTYNMPDLNKLRDDLLSLGKSEVEQLQALLQAAETSAVAVIHKDLFGGGVQTEASDPPPGSTNPPPPKP